MAQEYKSADLEAGLARAEAVEEQTATGTVRPSRGWKIGLALLAIGLCAAAAVCFVVHEQKQNINGGNEDLSHTLRQISNRRHSGNQQAAIHLEGDVSEHLTDTLTWSDNIDQAFYQGGLKLKNNKIIIPKRGLYFVYSQVSFNVNCQVNRDEAEGEIVHLRHVVNRETNVFDGKRPLLQAMRTSCKRGTSEERWYGAINLGAVFNLEEGDQLSTETAPLKSIDGDSGKNFFGVFAL